MDSQMPGSALQDIEFLFNSPAGIALYHLLIMVVSAMAIAVILFRKPRENSGRALFISGALFLIHLSGIIIDFIAVGGTGSGHTIAAVADRAISCLAILLLGWASLFPRRGGWGEILFLVLGILALIGGATVSWLMYPNLAGFWLNASLLSLIWDSLRSVLVTVMLAMLLFLRKPASWGVIFASFLLIIIGLVLQMLLTGGESQLPAFARFFDLLAIPMLIFRFPIGTASSQEAAASLRKLRQAVSSSSPLLSDLFHAEDDEGFLRSLSAWFCQALQAEVGFIVSPSGEERNIVFLAGFDRARSQAIRGFVVSQDQTAQLYQAVSTHQILRLDRRTAAQELGSVALQAGLTQAGPGLFAPLGDEGEQLGGLLLLSPYSSAEWNFADETMLGAFTQACTGAMRFVIARASLRNALEAIRTENDKVMREIAQLRTDRLDFETRFKQAEEALRLERQRNDSLQQLVSDQSTIAQQEGAFQAQITEMEDKLADAATREREKTAELDKLRNDSIQLKDALAAAETFHEESRQLKDQLEATSQELERWKQQSVLQTAEAQEISALRTAWSENEQGFQQTITGLETRLSDLSTEYAHLQSALLQAETEASVKRPAGTTDLQVISSIVSELRQPMSSAVGYTDLLLSESAGILGALQRKFMERVRAGITRMEALLDDLLQLSLLSDANAPSRLQPVDITSIVDAALTASSETIRERNLVVRMDISDALHPAEIDRDALQQIVNHLVQNAVLATPPEKEIAITAHSPGSERGGQSAMLFTVQDSGSGITPEDQARVFTRLYRADGPIIEGLGDTGVGMAVARTLTEALGGRVWMESQIGRGTVFFILLPWPISGTATPSSENSKFPRPSP